MLQHRLTSDWPHSSFSVKSCNRQGSMSGTWTFQSCWNQQQWHNDTAASIRRTSVELQKKTAQRRNFSTSTDIFNSKSPRWHLVRLNAFNVIFVHLEQEVDFHDNQNSRLSIHCILSQKTGDERHASMEEMEAVAASQVTLAMICCWTSRISTIELWTLPIWQRSDPAQERLKFLESLMGDNAELGKEAWQTGYDRVPESRFNHL